MAFTIAASWDFRGGEAASIKRASRIGEYDLTEGGSPSWSVDGVVLAGSTDRLYLTLPAELKLTGDLWIMAGVTRLGASSDYRAILGYAYNDADTGPGPTFALTDWGESLALRYALSAEVGDGLYGIAPSTADVPVAWAIVRTGSTFAVLADGETIGTKSDGGALVYSATSHLVLGPALGTSGASNHAYHWVLIGAGTLTDEEATDILADLDAYLYPEGPGTPTLSIEEQPAATQSGYLIDPAPVVHVLDAEGALDTSFTGDVTASLLGSGGVLLGTLTVAAVAGVATFSNLRPCEAGSYQLRFSAAGYANLDSAVFAVTAGEGSTVIVHQEAPMRPIRRNEPTAALRDIPITILADDGSPWDGDPDAGGGLKAQLSQNFGAETPSPANIVKLSAGNFRVRPTDAYTDIVEGSIIKARVPAAAGRREGIGWAHIIPADTYVSADAARKALVDAVIIASDGGNGYDVVKQPESNQIQRTIPDVGVITITATFSPSVPGIVSAGGS